MSPLGTSRQFAAAQSLGRYRSKADIGRSRAPTGRGARAVISRADDVRRERTNSDTIFDVYRRAESTLPLEGPRLPGLPVKRLTERDKHYLGRLAAPLGAAPFPSFTVIPKRMANCDGRELEFAGREAQKGV